MRWLVAIAVCLSALVGSAWADDQLKPEEVRQKYDETLVQLRAAQDRKAELAQENQKLVLENQRLVRETQQLTARIAEVEKLLPQMQMQIDSKQKECESFTDAAYFWRWRYLAWTAFLEQFPALQSQWEMYLDHSLPADTSSPWRDANWPYSALVVNAL